MTASDVVRATPRSGRALRGLGSLCDGNSELVEGWSTCRTERGLVEPTAEPDRIVRACERILPVDQDRRRTAEVRTDRQFGCVDDRGADLHAVELGRERLEVVSCVGPVRTIVEVQQPYLHEVHATDRETRRNGGGEQAAEEKVVLVTDIGDQRVSLPDSGRSSTRREAPTGEAIIVGDNPETTHWRGSAANAASAPVQRR